MKCTMPLIIIEGIHEKVAFVPTATHSTFEDRNYCALYLYHPQLRCFAWGTGCSFLELFNSDRDLEWLFWFTAQVLIHVKKLIGQDSEVPFSIV